MKLSDRELEAIFDVLKLSPEGRDLVREVRASQPTREPNSATAVTGRIVSRKMGHTVRTESVGGEVLACDEYEADGDVLEFWDQPVTLTVPYAVPGADRKTVTHAPDFMVIRRVPASDGTTRYEIAFEEWRSLARMQRLATADAERWRPAGEDEWTQVPVERWLAARGLGYRIRLLGSIPPMRARNRQILTDYRIMPAPLSGEVVGRVLEAVTLRPGITLAALLTEVADVRVDDVFAMLAEGTLKANLDDALLTDHEQVHLFEEGPITQLVRKAEHFVDRGEVALAPGNRVCIGEREFTVVSASPEQVFLNSPEGAEKFRRMDLERMIVDGDVTGLVDTRPDAIEKMLRYSPAAQATALKRLEVITPFLDGTTHPIERSQQRWVHDYEEAERTYGVGNGVLGLLPDTADRGNYVPRFKDDEEAFAAARIRKYLLTPDQMSGRWAHALYQQAASKEHVKAMGKSSWFERVRLLRLTDIARAQWGKRAAYGIAPRSSGGNGLPMHGDYAQQRVQMDHSPSDVPTVDSVTGEYLGQPEITLAIDEHTRYITAFALLYEKSSVRTDMVCIREHVRNTGRLPTTFATDNGKDFKSTQYQTVLGLRGVSILYRKAGDARDGATVEGGFKQIMQQLLWNLRGNTKIQKQMRKMDKENDPSKRAVYTFADLHDTIAGWITVYNDTPIPELGGSPRELYERSLVQAGSRPGKDQPYSVGFRALTALEPRHGATVTVTRDGVRISNLMYWCDGFLLPGVIGSEVPVRYEPYNARVAYAKVLGVWKVLTARYRELEACSERDLATVSIQLRARLGKNATPEQLAAYLFLVKEREDELVELQTERLKRRANSALRLEREAEAVGEHEDEEQQHEDRPDDDHDDQHEDDHVDQTQGPRPAQDEELVGYVAPSEAEVARLLSELASTDAEEAA